jgi:hypothetical protein
LPAFAGSSDFCAAIAYNFDVALTLREDGYSQAETEAAILGMFQGEVNDHSRAVPATVRAAYRYNGKSGAEAERSYLATCLASN